MRKVSVNFQNASKSYDIIIGCHLLEKLRNFICFKSWSRIGILTDSGIGSLWLITVKKTIGENLTEIVVNPGESEKNINTVKKIWLKLLQSKFDRKSLLINLGGGVIGDMGGFAASTFMRGIPFLQIPTTLLSQVDAGIGGKVGINIGGIKNAVGLFSQPIGVIIDINTLSTLPKREFISGFAEIIKHGLICDEGYFKFVISKPIEKFSSSELAAIIKKSCLIKSKIVETDEKEKNLRKVLNFGHTVGHAIESLSLKTMRPLLHGEAVSLGMIAESKLADLLGLISKEEFILIENSIGKIGLPTRVKQISLKKVIEKMQNDKKTEAGKIKWSLPKKIGNTVINVEAPQSVIEKSIKYIINK